MTQPARHSTVVLNVNDSDSSLLTNSRILRAAGYTVHEAIGGAEAIRLARKVRPELILLDVKLAGMNSMDICHAIRADPELAATLVLQTSASFINRSARIKALDSGADSYLVEPLDPAELIATVRALLRRRRVEYPVRDNESLPRLATHAANLDTWKFDVTDLASMSAAEFVAGCELPTLGGVSSAGLCSLHPEDRPRLDAALAAALAGDADYDVQYRVISPIGDISWLASQAVVVRDSSGRPLHLIGAGVDITERKQAELEREQLLHREQSARLEAEDATRLKDEFLATVSHELRTPLNAIIGWVHLLRTGQLDEEASTRAVESIDRSAQSQSQLINDLLDVSRIISGKLRLEMRTITMLSVVEMALDTVKPAIQGKGITLDVDLDAGVGSTAGDPDRLQQVVWNLLTNAVKFSNKGGKIAVRLERSGSNVLLTVRDDGVGIDPQFLPFVFHPFRQGDGGSTRKHPGLGLGLAIVRQLVELHGGRVRAASPGKGNGSTFTVTLPVSVSGEGPAAAVAPESVRVAANERPGSLPDLNGVSVLVVDDDEDAREILATVLIQAGASVTKAADTAEALAHLAHEVPTILLSDIGMPGQDGYAFIRELRRRDADKGGRVPAVALTAYARSDDRFRALASGFQMHIAKPVEVSELLAIVANLAKRASNA
jgi:signal transduction histidine kinase